jgi:nitrogen-specific signal transduction histidine kinase
VIDARTLKHELRTPINHIVGYSELLVDCADDVGRRGVSAQARVIHTHATALARLMESKLVTLGDEADQAYLCDLRDSILPHVEQIAAETLCSPAPLDSSYTRDLARLRGAADTLALLLTHHLGITPPAD